MLFNNITKERGQVNVELYIYFNGNCREAVEFYAAVFDTEKPQIMTYGDAPPNPNFTLPPAAQKLVIHSRLNINGTNVMFSDVFPGNPYVIGNNISLIVTSAHINEIQSLFHKLKEGGTVAMDLQETFWSKCYGSVIDKFGNQWQLSLDNSKAK
jgi:PhnB protein